MSNAMTTEREIAPLKAFAGHSLSVYPLFLVLGDDGTIGAYADETIVRIDLEQNKKAGHPACQVYKLNQHMLTVTYEPAREFAEQTEPPWKYCTRHAGEMIGILFPYSDRRGNKDAICRICTPRLAAEAQSG